MAPWMTGADFTTPSRMMATCLPMLLAVNVPHLVVASPFSDTVTMLPPVDEFTPAFAFVMASPRKMTALGGYVAPTDAS